jgi:hypothetical protein
MTTWMPETTGRTPYDGNAKEDELVSREQMDQYAELAEVLKRSRLNLEPRFGSITFSGTGTVANRPAEPETTTPRAFSSSDELTPNPRTTLLRAVDGIRRGHVDSAFDELFDVIDALVFKPDLGSVDRLLASACTLADAPLKLLVGLLTITLPLRGRLSRRRELVGVVRTLAEQIGGPAKAEAVLRGLE